MRIGKVYRRLSFREPGHFYSPLVDPATLTGELDRIWPPDGTPVPSGIDMAIGDQLALMAQLARHAPFMPYEEVPRSGFRYHFGNNYFEHTDAVILHAMLLENRPSRVVEVGSGWSSAILLDVNQHDMDLSMSLTFIDPDPGRLQTLLRSGDAQLATLLAKRVQEVPLSVFDALQAGDILFIDSSHVIKTGSDVCHLMFEVLPRLRPGVLIHVHDIFEGFEYPQDWVVKGFQWNEAYAWRAFLMYNNEFRIRLFANHLHRHHPEAFAPWPMAYRNTGGSLWLERLAHP